MITCRRCRRSRSEPRRVRWAQRGGGGNLFAEGLIDVLHDELRFTYGLTVVDEHGHLLVHRVGLEEELALVLEVLLDVLVAQTLEAESKSDEDAAQSSER